MKAFNVILLVYKIIIIVLIIAAIAFAVGILVDDEISEWKYEQIGSDEDVMECAPRMLLTFALLIVVNIGIAILALIGVPISLLCKDIPKRKRHVAHFEKLALLTLGSDAIYFLLILIASFI